MRVHAEEFPGRKFPGAPRFAKTLFLCTVIQKRNAMKRSTITLFVTLFIINALNAQNVSSHTFHYNGHSTTVTTIGNHTYVHDSDDQPPRSFYYFYDSIGNKYEISAHTYEFEECNDTCFTIYVKEYVPYDGKHYWHNYGKLIIKKKHGEVWHERGLMIYEPGDIQLDSLKTGGIPYIVPDNMLELFTDYNINHLSSRKMTKKYGNGYYMKSDKIMAVILKLKYKY